MFALYAVALLTLQAVVLSTGQVLGPGSCPQLQVVQNFNVTAYFGKWYQIVRYPNAFEFGDCSTANYGPVNADGKVAVHNEEVRNGQISSIDGTAELANATSAEAKLIVRFVVPPGVETVADYWVLSTDYVNYSVVWACREQCTTSNSQAAWVLARQKPLTAEVQAKVDAVIASNGIRKDHFVKHDLAECSNVPSFG